MKWLLLIFVFEGAAAQWDGAPRVERRWYDSQAECDLMGNHLREIVTIPDGVKSLSVCVGPDDLRPER